MRPCRFIGPRPAGLQPFASAPSMGRDRMIVDLTQVVQALQSQESVGAQIENLDGDHNHYKIPDLEAEDVVEDENAFYDAGAPNGTTRGGLEEWLLHALDLNGR